MSVRICLLAVLAFSCGPTKPATAPRPPVPAVPQTDIVLAIDMSKSMTERDLQPTRLVAVKRALQRFVANSPHRIGVVSFSTQAVRVSGITSDRRALDANIANLDVDKLTGMGSGLGDGLALAVDELRTSSAERKIVVVLSDGDWNWVNQYDPEQAAALAKSQRIEIYTVLVAAVIEGCSNAELMLKLISATTDGAYYRAVDPGSLSRGLQAIGGALDARSSP